MEKGTKKRKIHGLDILYEDMDIIVINKSEGVLTEETRKHESFCVENALNDYVRKGQSRSRKSVILVHRLDRETSGLLVVAKNEDAAEFLRESWHTSVEKFYLAAVWGGLDVASGKFEGFLYGDKDLYVREADSILDIPQQYREGAKFSETAFETLVSNRDKSLLKIRLLSGRRNQIRVQFASRGMPLMGDMKYGAGHGSYKGRMCLHAYSLSFPHPHTKEIMTFKAPIPGVFFKLFREFKEEQL